MSRRAIWGSLAIVALLLVSASYLASPDSWQAQWRVLRAVPWAALGHGTWAQVSGWATGRPEVAGGALLLAATIGVALSLRRARARRRGQDTIDGIGQGPVGSFEDAMAGALTSPASLPATGRGHQAADLAALGQPIHEIARATRLGQDAIRTLVAGRTEDDRQPARIAAQANPSTEEAPSHPGNPLSPQQLQNLTWTARRLPSAQSSRGPEPE